MKLYFEGHQYRYAAEQMLMTLFPGEKPVYPDGKPEGRRMEIRLSRSVRFTTAVCRYRDGESSGLGRAAVKNEKLTDPVRTDSLCQQVIKLAIYRAVLRAGHQKPVWGALTGVRPGKLMYPLLLSGLSEQEALRQFESGYDVSHERAQLCLDASRATLKADRLLQPKDVCLYVGIPFCPTRCAYCSFVSQSTEKSLSMIAPFLEALDREIDAVAEQVRQTGLRVVSLYMGGGTPTTLTSAQLDSLLTKLETAFDLSGLRECTVEAGRPDTITMEKLAVLRRHGTDRVSVNPQTMSDAVLEAIGRRHSAEDIRKALRQVRETGGFAVNMDLIAGLPTDSVEGFSRTVDAVLELEPENITVHTLSIKRGARLHFGEESLPTDGLCWTMPGPACGRMAIPPIISIGRRTCPAVSRTPAGRNGEERTCTTSASWKNSAASLLWVRAGLPSWCAGTAERMSALSRRNIRPSTSRISTGSAGTKRKSAVFTAMR